MPQPGWPAGEMSRVLVAIAELEQAQGAHPELPLALWEVAERTANTLLSWNVPPAVAIAALLAPLLEWGLFPPQDLAERYDAQALTLAGRLLAWRLANPEVEPPREQSATHYSLQLRRLIREAYLDLPGLPFILLLLADHGARLGHSALASARLAGRTDAVFIPLAEILGIWDLRRTWIDLSMALQFPAEYQRVEETWLASGGQEKAIALADLEKKLIAAVQAAGMPAPLDVKLVQPSPGVTVRHRHDGSQKEDMADEVVIRVLCGSTADCYRILGLVHGLGKPVTPRFSERFSDYIATPQSSGYRALHTAIVYKLAKDADAPDSMPGGTILVDFRILTPEIDKLNERGVIAALHLYPQHYGDAPAWWNWLDNVSGKLHRRYKYAEAVTIQGFLGAHEIGSHAQPLYVFTPRGEIILLDEGSTPIDFAYQIHRELSHHAARIGVNGRQMPYNYPLRNGDLVQVHYDPHFSGPDLSWLGFVATARARTAIRRGLTRRAQAVHAGRSKIEEALIKMIDTYAREKHYPLAITTKRLDAFLFQVARARGLPDLLTLYQEVADDRIAVDQIVRRLISAELAPAVVDLAGARLAYPAGHIRLCDRCRPVPGDPLIAFERRKGRLTTILILHQAGPGKCPGLVQAGRQVAVRWAEPADPKNQELAMFQIGGEDRYRLLEDVLAAVYEERSARLYRVEAQAYTDGSADITLAVETDSLGGLGEIRKRIEEVGHVHQVLSFPASPAQRLALQAPAAKHQPNPYATQEVYDRWMFYDREEPIQQIRTWLAGPLPAGPLILHGQRRVGKSSLARYLMHEVIPQQGLALPVFVDLQGLSGFAPQNIANYFVRAVYTALQVPEPAPLAAEEPMPWLDRALQEAVALLGGARLLVMIDEFNMLLDLEHLGRLDPLVFANLRAVLNGRRDVHWLLIVQDTHFRDPARWGSAGPLFQQTHILPLPLLDARWAAKLILEPAWRCGIAYQTPDLVERIYELTAGSPFLIQVLCYLLIDRVRRQNRTLITAGDLQRAVDLISGDGHRYFAHFVETLTGLRRVVLAAVAARGQGGAWVDVGALAAELRRRVPNWDLATAQRALAGLEQQGILATCDHAGAPQVRIPMRLFQEWVQRTVELDSAIAEWHQTAP